MVAENTPLSSDPMAEFLAQKSAEARATGRAPVASTNPSVSICLCGHPEAFHIESPNRGASLEVPAMGLMSPISQGGLGKDHGCFIHHTPVDKSSDFGRHWPPVCRCSGFTPVIQATGWAHWFRSHSPRDRSPNARTPEYGRYIYPPLAISLIKISDENARRQEVARRAAEPSRLPAKDRPRDLAKTLIWLVDCSTCGASSDSVQLFPYFTNEDLDPAVGCPSCILTHAYDASADPEFDSRVYKEDRV